MQKLLLSALSIFWTALVWGQTAPTNFHDLFGLAWDRSVASRTAQGRQAEAEAGHVQASSLLAGAPVLGALHRSDRYSEKVGQREQELSISVPVWLPGQRLARGRLAEAVSGETDAAIRLMQLDLAGDLRERTWAVASAMAELDSARYRADLAKTLHHDVARRLKAGELARTDLLLAEQESLSADGELADASLRLEQATARLKVLTGRSLLPPSYEETRGSPSADVHPRLAAAQRALDRAESQQRYLRESRRDAPEVSLSYREDRALAGAPREGAVGIAIRFPLASEARNLPRETAAQTEVLTARGELLQIEYVLKSDIEVAAQALAANERRLELAIQRHLALEERMALLKKSFDFGELSLPEFLRSQTQALEAKADLARQQALRGLAIARYNQALGVLP